MNAFGFDSSKLINKGERRLHGLKKKASGQLRRKRSEFTDASLVGSGLGAGLGIEAPGSIQETFGFDPDQVNSESFDFDFSSVASVTTPETFSNQLSPGESESNAMMSAEPKTDEPTSESTATEESPSAVDHLASLANTLVEPPSSGFDVGQLESQLELKQTLLDVVSGKAAKESAPANESVEGPAPAATGSEALVEPAQENSPTREPSAPSQNTVQPPSAETIVVTPEPPKEQVDEPLQESSITELDSAETKAELDTAPENGLEPRSDAIGREALEIPTSVDVSVEASANSGSQVAQSNAQKVEGDSGAAQIEGSKQDAPTQPESAPANPRDAIGEAIKSVRHRAKRARVHTPGDQVASNAMAAGVMPDVEHARAVASATVDAVGAVPEQKVDQDSFADRLQKALKDAVPIPKDKDDAEKLSKTGGKATTEKIRNQLSAETGKATEGVRQVSQVDAAPENETPMQDVTLAKEEAGPKSAPIDPLKATPKPIDRSRLDFSAHREGTDQVMQQSQVTVEQLQKGNEPEFSSVVDSRKSAEQKIADAPAAYAETESGELGAAETNAMKSLVQGLGGLDQARGKSIGSVAKSQTSTQSQESAERARIANHVNKIKERTQATVKEKLDQTDETAVSMFSVTLKLAELAYERVFWDSRGGWFSRLFESDEDLDAAFKLGRAAYEEQVIKGIKGIATHVENSIADIKQVVADGQQEITEFAASLSESSRQLASAVLESVRQDFGAMTEAIDSRSEKLIDRLVGQYRESQTRLAAKEKQLREESRSIWQRIKDATIGVVTKILEFKNLLTSVLKGAAGVVSSIIADPIGFVGNLVSGVKMGFQLFLDNIGQHLKAGLMKWLFGAMQSTGIEIPEQFDAKGVFQLITQVLGLTYQYIRKKAVRILGDKTVQRIESVVEIFKILRAEGLAGVWNMIQERLAGLKDSVMDQIREYISEKIIKAGITWVLSLFNPAGAFFKACQAIYNIIMFFVERGKQIAELIQSITSSLAAIAAGNVEAMAQRIQATLANALPVAIGFLANLLNITGLTRKIQDIIGKLREKVDQAINWLINKAVQMFRKKSGGDKKPGDQKDENKWVKKYGPEKGAKIEAGLAEIRKEEKSYLNPDKEITEDEAKQVAKKVLGNNDVFTALAVRNNQDRWEYHFTASPSQLGVSTKIDDAGASGTIEKIKQKKSLYVEFKKSDPPRLFASFSGVVARDGKEYVTFSVPTRNGINYTYVETEKLDSEQGKRWDFLPHFDSELYFKVGKYDSLLGYSKDRRAGLEAHHVGQKAVMNQLLNVSAKSRYDEKKGPSILVPKVGHTINGPRGKVDSSTSGFKAVSTLVARDFRELAKVYPDIPSDRLDQLMTMNQSFIDMDNALEKPVAESKTPQKPKNGNVTIRKRKRD